MAIKILWSLILPTEIQSIKENNTACAFDTTYNHRLQLLRFDELHTQMRKFIYTRVAHYFVCYALLYIVIR